MPVLVLVLAPVLAQPVRKAAKTKNDKQAILTCIPDIVTSPFS
jgi:hypothetical protein